MRTTVLTAAATAAALLFASAASAQSTGAQSGRPAPVDERSTPIAGSTTAGSNMQPTFSGSTDFGQTPQPSGSQSAKTDRGMHPAAPASTATMADPAVNADMGTAQTSAGTRAYSATSGGEQFGGTRVTANAPIPDTAETRRMYRPLSNAGRRSSASEGPVG